MVALTLFAMLQHPMVQRSDIADVRRRPAVISLTNAGNHAFLNRVLNVPGDEALTPGVMNLRQPHNLDINAFSEQRIALKFGCYAGVMIPGFKLIFPGNGRGVVITDARSGGDD
ncbi:hypothetical protein D3C76_1488500 [compost metagenome]